MSVSIRDRIMGSLLGLAIGDAMGGPVQFMAPGTFEPVSGYRSGGKLNIKPGEWSDDTSLALCLAESLVETGKFSLLDQSERYLSWLQEGHLSCRDDAFDIGMTTSSAIFRFQKTRDPKPGSTNERSAGNGSIMRIAPVPLRYYKDPKLAVRLSGESSVTTHKLKVCQDACEYLGALIVGALSGQKKEELLTSSLGFSEELWSEPGLLEKIDSIRKGSFKEKEPPEIRGSGYVVESLEAALWAFNRAKSFEETILLAVNLGDDSDTTGAVAGQLAGAYYGIGDIPPEWVSNLRKSELILSFADGIYQLTERQ